jgi:hypothetical protein
MIGTNFYAANNKTIELRNGCRSLVLLNNRQEVFTTGAAGPGNGTMTMHLATAGTYYGIQLIGGALAGGETDWTIYGEDGAIVRKLHIRGTNLTISYEGIDVDELHDSEIHGAGYIDHSPTKVNVRTACTACKFSHCDVTLPAGSTDIELFPPLSGSKTWDPAEITAGGNQHTDITVAGAEIGDHVQISSSLNLGLVLAYGYIEATNTARAVYFNPTGSGINFASHTVYATITKKVWT